MEQRPLYRKDVFCARFSDCSAANSPLVSDALRRRKEQDTGTDVPAHTLKRVEEFIQMAVGWVRAGRYE